MRTVFKWLVRVIAGLIVTAVLLVVVALWSTRLVPYAVADGKELRRVLSGRWDWSNRATPCADSAHTITFTNGPRTMLITQTWLDSATGAPAVSEYDILAETPSTIRGAIRGETRTTDDGVPVVWDLVLTGRDSYRWHRTDWMSWFATVEIVRCGEPGASEGLPRPQSPG